MFYSFEKNKHLYEQLYVKIKNDILNGNINAGDKLPSKRNLAASLEISVVTIEKAYEQLVEEGYIYSVPKSGYFVCEVGKISKKKFICKEPENKTKVYEYDFSTGAVDTEYFPFSVWAKSMRDIITEKDRELLRKPDYRGIYELRSEIASYIYNMKGIEVSPERIVIGAGSEYLINIIIQLLGTDRIYGMENPGYGKIKNILSCYGIVPDMIDIDENGLCAEKIKENTNVIYVTPQHHFPLGTVMPVKRRLDLIKWAEMNDGYIIEDDYDSEFRYVGKPIPAMKSLDNSERVIYIDTFAKKLAPSVRISYAVLPDSLSYEYEKKMKFYSATVSSFEQYTLAGFIKNGYFERYINKMLRIYRKRLDRIMKCTENMGFIEVIGGNVGLHVLLNVKNGMSEKELIVSAEKNGIHFLGISDYYENRSFAPKATLVAGFSGISEEKIIKAFDILKNVW